MYIRRGGGGLQITQIFDKLQHYITMRSLTIFLLAAMIATCAGKLLASLIEIKPKFSFFFSLNCS